MFKFQKLDVWGKSINFCQIMIGIADSLSQRYQFSLGEQLRRAAISIPNNIAEGAGRRNRKEAVQFFNIAKGSVYEVVNLLVILSRQKLLKDKYDRPKLYSDSEEIAKMLTGLMRSHKDNVE